MTVHDNHFLNFSEVNVNFNEGFLPSKPWMLPILRLRVLDLMHLFVAVRCERVRNENTDIVLMLAVSILHLLASSYCGWTLINYTNL